MLVPRDLNKCAVGQCKYVFITAPDGGIVNDPVLLRLGENHFWISVADSDVLLWAMGVAYNSGLDVKIGEPDVGPLQVQGPKSKDVLVDLFGDRVLEIPYYYLREFELEGLDVIVSRTGYTAELGFEIYARDASRNAEKLWDLVLEAGKPHGLAVIGPCHIRRIEGGILAYGADMWLDTNPYEVDMGYEWMVDLEQAADFVGKEALRRIKEEGIKRKLVGVEIGGEKLGSYIDGSMIDFFPVSKNGDRIGNVTSACYSPRLDKNIGYAMVPIELADLGTDLEVETPDGRTSAVVVQKPFIDPKKEIPKQDLAEAGTKGAPAS
jgi:aminomethyltransferase